MIQLGLWRLVPFLIAALGLFLSISIALPAPTFGWLIFSVGAPEFSPLIAVLNIVAVSLILVRFKPNYLNLSSLAAALLALILSLIPLIQFSATNARMQTQMEHSLGKDYLRQIPNSLTAKMRSRPLNIIDLIRGIDLPQIRIQRGIQYAEPNGQPLKLNLYQPLTPGKYPALIIIYGGAWQRGNASNNEAFSRYIASHGYVVVAIDYRHAPNYKFPTQLADVQTSLKYIRDRAEAWEIDLQKVAIMGRFRRRTVGIDRSI